MNRIVTLLASGLGLGFVPFAPGTFGTLLGMVLAFLFPDNKIMIGAVAVLGIWIANEAEVIFQQHDSPKIVIDEAAGYLLASYGWSGYYLLVAFVLFRFFDIVKPFPVKQLQNLPGGLGIMADDLVAGIFSNIVLYIVTFLSH